MTEHTRRDVLRYTGAAASVTAGVGAGVVTADDLTTDDTLQAMYGTPGVSPSMGALAYFTGQAIDYVNPWGGESESDFKSKYEYEQRVDIYKQAYNWEQITKRQLAGIESQANLLSNYIMETGLREVYRQADADADLSTAITEGNAVIDEEFIKVYNQLMQHWEQTVMACESWYDYLSQMSSELSGSTTVSYTMLPYDPYTDSVTDTGDSAIDPEDLWGFADKRVNNVDDTTTQRRNVFAHLDTNGMPVTTFLCLPMALDDLTENVSWSEGYFHAERHMTQEQVANRIDSFTYPDDVGTMSQITQDDGDNTSQAFTSYRVQPPDPADFNVDPADVEDISDHPKAHLLLLHRWYKVIDRLQSVYSDATSGLETWCNSNYSDLKANTDQWSIDDMSSPRALQEAADTAENPAEAALMVHAMGIPIDNEDDVLLRWPDLTDADGNMLEASGYIGMTQPPATGLPVGEVIDPDSFEGEVYFAHWMGDLPRIEQESVNYNTTNTSDNDTNTSDGDSLQQATYTILTEPFKIVQTADGADSVQLTERDVSKPDYDWQKVTELLEEQNQALLDAQNETIETANASDDGGGGGSIFGGNLPWLPIGAGLGGAALLLKGAGDKANEYRPGP